MPVCIISSVSKRETEKQRQSREERVKGMQLAVGRSVPAGQDLTLCLMANLLWGMGSNRLTAVCTSFKLLAVPLANTSVSCCKSSATT